MIYLHVGSIGSGKTYSCTWEVYQWLKKGVDVYVDWPLDITKYQYKKYNSTLGKIKRFLGFKQKPFGNLYKYSNLEDIYGISNGQIYMDEAHRFLNARNWEKTDPDFIRKMSQSRKYQTDLHFICQYPAQIEATVRKLATVVVVHSRFAWFFVHKEFDGQFVDKLNDLVAPPKSFYTGITFFRKSFANVYDTRQLLGARFEDFKIAPIWNLDIFMNWVDTLKKTKGRNSKIKTASSPVLISETKN